jgi:cell division protein FtsQ
MVWRTLRRLAMIMVVLALAVVVFWTPVFALQADQIVVTGLGGVVTSQEVEQVLAGSVGKPLARLSLGQIAKQLEGRPGIKTAKVQRQWPHGLLVDVEPRQPVAVVRDQQRWVVLDANAVQLGYLDQAPEALPQVAVPLTDSSGRVLRSVLAVIDALPDSLRSQVVNIGAQTVDTVSFYLTSGQQVVWGNAEQSALKAATLSVMMRTPATLYDVSAPTTPFLRSEAAATPTE